VNPVVVAESGDGPLQKATVLRESVQGSQAIHMI
jgi:hypothetical protein